MSDNLIQELINEAATDFYHHLNLEKNDRILFSGKFGKGKTTFLTEFFSNQVKYAGESKYNVIFLDPVNYTVSSNEDIFKYIKYDILLHLLIKQGADLENIKFTFNEVASYYISKHPLEPLEGLLKYIPKVGMYLDQMLPHIKKLRQNILDQKKDAESATEDSQANAFIVELQSMSYSVYENDIITELIRKLLAGFGNLQNVLVIDNMDRIDPEHIFRILNIFSAHLDYRLWDKTFNKFQFDKVLLVCDVQNIRNIYANRYGNNVDFSGYIDKFYSIEVFYFQNYEQLRTTSHKILRTLKIMDSWGNLQTLNSFKNDFGIFHLLTTFVFQNQISLRQLLDFCKHPMGMINKSITSHNGNNEKDIQETPILEMIILAKMSAGYDNLYKVIESLRDTNTPISGHENHFKNLMQFRLFRLYGSEIQGDKTYKFNGKELRLSVAGDMWNITKMDIRYIEIPSSGLPVEFKPTYSDYYSLYLEILLEYHQLKIIE